MPTDIQPPIYAILGGTFDPCHLGHLQILNMLETHLHPEKIAVMPARNPIHKTAFTAYSHRIAMLELMLADTSFSIDTTELGENTSGETIDTVIQIRKQYPHHNIMWVFGDDIFTSFNQWKQWQDIRNYCNILIIKRTIPALNSTLKNYMAEHQTTMAELRKAKHGAIAIAPWPILSISSTSIRQNIVQGISNDNYLDSKVCNYIKENNIYSD